MTYMNYLEIIQFGEVYGMGIVTFTMLQVLKLQALAWNYKDGATDQATLSKDQIDKSVKDFPSILEISSYTFYCNTAALGVFFEFQDYKRFIEQTNEYKNIPSPILPSLKWLIQCFAFVGVFAIGTQYVPVDYCWSENFAKHSFGYQVVFYFLASTIRRAFYYSPFSATTGAIIASGFGYNGVKTVKEKDTHQWDKVIGVYWIECETITSPVEVFRYWNYQVHIWLKKYVYMRLITPGKKPGAFESMSTFVVSGLWHGFYPCYMICFGMAAIMQELAKDIFKSRILFSGIPQSLKTVIAWLTTWITLNYFGVCIAGRVYEKVLSFTKATNGFVFICIVAGFPIWRFLIVPYVRKIESKQAKKTQID